MTFLNEEKLHIYVGSILLFVIFFSVIFSFQSNAEEVTYDNEVDNVYLEEVDSLFFANSGVRLLNEDIS